MHALPRPLRSPRGYLLLALALTSTLVAPLPGAHATGSYDSDPSELQVFGSTASGRASIPTELANHVRTIKDVSAGQDHVVALDGNGKLYAWGDDAQGEGHVPAVLQSQAFKAVSAGQDYSLALTIGGKVRAWGTTTYGVTAVPEHLEGRTITAVSAGGSVALALDSTGVVHAWGDNSVGQLDVPNDIQGKVARISAGGAFAVAVTTDKRVVTWGSNLSGEQNVPASLQGKDIDEIDAGWRHTAVLLKDATLVMWGDNSAGELNAPAGTDFRYWNHVSAGPDYTVAVSTRSTRIQVWGKGATTTFANAPTVSPSPARLSAGGEFAVLGNAKLVTNKTGTIYGTGRVGEELTATPGTFKPLAPDKIWGSWREPGGPTIATGYTFTPTPDLVGKYLIFDTNGQHPGYTVATNNTAIPVVAGQMSSTTPTISGSARVGRTLTAGVTFSPTPDRVQYDWHVDGVFQQATAGPDYVVRAGDLGKRITVSVAGFKDGYDTRFSGFSSATAPVSVDPPLTVKQAPALPATLRVDQKATVVPPVSDPPATSVTYQWLRDGQAILGATGTDYTPTGDDLIHTISVEATLHHADFADTASRSAGVSVGFGTWTTVTSQPSLVGDARVGGTLTASTTFAPKPDSLTYEWRVDDQPVVGRTGATFSLTPAELGRTVTVRAVAARAGYQAYTTSWKAAATIARGQLVVTGPTVSGVPDVGQVLTAAVDIAPQPGAARIDWFADGEPRAEDTSTYTVREADRGKQITARLTATRTAYADAVVTSEPVGPVPAAEQPVIAFVTPPGITGRTIVGQALTAIAPQTSVEAGIGLQWLRGGVPVAGATGSTYVLGAADVGRSITLQAVAQRDGWRPAGASSPATAAVAKARPTVRAKAKSRRGRGTVVVTASAPGLRVPTATVTVRVGKRVVARGKLVRGKAVLTLRKRVGKRARLVVTVAATPVTVTRSVRIRLR